MLRISIFSREESPTYGTFPESTVTRSVYQMRRQAVHNVFESLFESLCDPRERFSLKYSRSQVNKIT